MDTKFLIIIFYQQYLLLCEQAQNYEDLNVSSLTSFILTDNHSAEALPSTSDGKIK